jgi:hypothetical protein
MTKNKPVLSADTTHTLYFSQADLDVLLQVLATSAQLFNQVAVAAEPDSELMKMYDARGQLTSMILNRIKTMVFIGEPVSRDIH